MSCPPRETLVAWLDGELTENEAERIAAHVRTCDTCRAEEAKLRTLKKTLVALGNPAPDREFVRSVTQRLSTRPARSPFRLPVGFGVALAAVLAVVIYTRRPPALESGGVFEARGVARPGLADSRHLGFTANVVHGGVSRELHPGEEVAATDGYTFTLRNLSTVTPYFMVLALDAGNEVHWFYPAFPTADADPVSPQMPAGAPSIPLPEGVVPSSPAPGAFRLLALFSPGPLKARAVEAELAHGNVSAFLQAHPDVTVQVLTVRLAP